MEISIDKSKVMGSLGKEPIRSKISINNHFIYKAYTKGEVEIFEYIDNLSKFQFSLLKPGREKPNFSTTRTYYEKLLSLL